jgi:oligoribonuclease NrnB/cAMP/cGMP phosphodiesterase (DHH superfamily)
MENMNNIVIVYHENCNDGLMSAAILKTHFENQEIYPYVHPLGYTVDSQTRIFNTLNNFLFPDKMCLYFVDISLPLEKLKQLVPNFKQTIVMDHHDDTMRQEVNNWFMESRPDNFMMIFDPKRSGAGIVWDYLYPDQTRPYAVNWIEDRDLWKWQWPEESKALHLAISTEPRTIENFERLLHPQFKLSRFLDMGKAIAKFEIQVKENIKRYAWQPIPELVMVNCPAQFSSDVGHELIQEKNCFVVCLFEVLSDRIKLAFRSTNGQAKQLAESMGGGGHPTAAGAHVFYLDIKKLEQQLCKGVEK